MNYKKYPNYTKIYVVVHNTGFGVQESPYVEKEVVFESDDMQFAQTMANSFTDKNNPDGESSWLENTYHVNVNTLSEGGKKLFEEFGKKFEKDYKERLESGEFKEVKIGDMTYLVPKHSPFDEPAKIDAPIRIAWSEPKKEIE